MMNHVDPKPDLRDDCGGDDHDNVDFVIEKLPGIANEPLVISTLDEVGVTESSQGNWGGTV